MAQMKTPGVYIIEKNAFPNSVVEVATAIPAFIGHTQFARDGNKDLTGIPFRISSMLSSIRSSVSLPPCDSEFVRKIPRVRTPPMT